MLLMDTINESQSLLSQVRSVDPFLPKIFEDFTERLKDTPRFLLDEKATELMTELTLGRPKVILDALRYVRIPYPAMWIEWPESAREGLRKAFGQGDEYIVPGRPLPNRLGFFIEADESGRKGTVQWFWNSALEPGEPSIPNIAPIGPTFDLDADYDQPIERLLGLSAANLARLWKDNRIQHDALLRIWRTARHGPMPRWGDEYLKRYIKDNYALGGCYADVYGEYITIWAALLMLTASRPIIEHCAVRMTKLNKHRKAKGRPLLFDHTLVTLKLNRDEMASRPRAPLGYMRKSPRVHIVSSYLARRGNRHWIVQPYWRGHGDIIHRRVDVKG